MSEARLSWSVRAIIPFLYLVLAICTTAYPYLTALKVSWLSIQPKLIVVFATCILTSFFIVKDQQEIKTIVARAGFGSTLIVVGMLAIMAQKEPAFLQQVVYNFPMYLLLPFSLAILGQFLFTIKVNKKSKHAYFGSAAWANKQDLANLNVYSKQNGLWVGADFKGKNLYLPLQNKLILAPPGGGKTSCASIPALLSYEGPVFVFDVKGELWATTARHRAQSLKRKIITIDPFGVTRQPHFAAHKPATLLEEYCFNPLDLLMDGVNDSDRILTAFAASLLITEGGYAKHFEENAKILIRGILDYLIAQNHLPRTLPTLYQLLSDPPEALKQTFIDMQDYSERAASAANQVLRVGGDEKGSILSTTYRQLDWLSDRNIQRVLNRSNFDLRDFLDGNMDIYLILPEDQVKEYARLVRMIMTMLMFLFVQTKRTEKPKQKVLFLLEEVAQLGYCADVEQAIEILRARGVVIWTFFQSLSQIKSYQKPDLFLGAPIKQIFTIDDVPTMQWVQSLAGKQTIQVSNQTMSKGKSKRFWQLNSNTITSGTGESIHETGVDLLHLNEIRELPKDEQLIFIQSARPIHCQKIQYLNHPLFEGKYDSNPLEDSN